MSGVRIGRNHYGLALYATQPFRQGWVVARMQGAIVPESAKPNFQVGANTFMGAMGPVLDAINHSCEPNVAAMVELPGRPVTAMRDIEPGEEIVADYSVTMTSPSDGVFTCLCRSARCRGQGGGGFHTIPKWDQERYLQLGIVPRYVKDHYLSTLV